MGGACLPGPLAGNPAGDWIDDGTTCRWRTPAPGTVRTRQPAPAAVAAGAASEPLFEYSEAFEVAVDIPFSIAPGMTWDGFWRLIYDRTNETLQKQADLLLSSGRIDASEARRLVDARNELLLKLRSRLTPFGELYSEILKPRAGLKSIEQFLAEKGTVEAVMRSLGRTRAVVDRFGAVARVAGPATIVLEVSLTAIVIQQAPPGQRDRVRHREIGGAAGSIGGGLAGGWAGCAAAAAFASPSLTVPVVGPVSTGTACLVGGILGGMGVGWFGRWVGEAAGEKLYEMRNEMTDFRWTRD